MTRKHLENSLEPQQNLIPECSTIQQAWGQLTLYLLLKENPERLVWWWELVA